MKLEPPAKLRGKRGLPWTGSLKLIEPFGVMDPKAKARGWITAVDADDGAVRWKHEMPTPIVAAVTTTAGGIVFAADLMGRLHVYDTRTGDECFSFDLGQPIGGGIVSYQVGGRQYIAVAAGLHAPLTWQVKSAAPASLVVFALPP